MVSDGAKWTQYRVGKERRDLFLATFAANGCDLEAALEVVGVGRHAYIRWRKVYPDFASHVDVIRNRAADVEVKGGKWTEGFAAFRKTYFGMDSPWFHQDVVRVLDNVGEPGEIVMILLPPEHGKTTLLEDYLNFKYAMDPGFRCSFGSASQSHARKVGGRVKNRMEMDGPCRPYVISYGPFAPQNQGKRKAIQPWGADFWSVYKKGSEDERDYSFVALGMGSEIIGSRTDVLMVDDPQSRKTLGLTDTLVEKFRQDWLSRPGTKGRTIIVGSRVGEGDFYSALIDAGIVDHLIVYPALDEDGKWLWPERYSPEEYDRMRRNVGEEAWARNYLMRPQGRGDASFTDELIDECKNPYRSILHDRQDGQPPNVLIGWDPGYGTNAIMGVAVDEKRFWPLHIKTDQGLASPQALFAVLEEEIIRYIEQGYVVVEVIVEDKAFQHGLLADERMTELVGRYGFRVHGHQTGGEKNDEDIGVPGMVLSMNRREISFPDADAPSQANMDGLYGELKAWRPKVRGTKLRQDRVMAMWFAWLRWRRKKHALAAARPDRPPIATKSGLPWTPTRVPMTTGRT